MLQNRRPVGRLVCKAGMLSRLVGRSDRYAFRAGWQGMPWSCQPTWETRKIKGILKFDKGRSIFGFLRVMELGAYYFRFQLTQLSGRFQTCGRIYLILAHKPIGKSIGSPVGWRIHQNAIPDLPGLGKILPDMFENPIFFEIFWPTSIHPKISNGNPFFIFWWLLWGG